MKRLFIEIDKRDAGVITTLSRTACFRHYLDPHPEMLFDTIIDNASKHEAEIIAAIHSHDEIYMDTGFLPRGQSTENSDLFNKFMKYSTVNKITGKKVYICRPGNRITWRYLSKKLLKLCFEKDNTIFVEPDDIMEDGWVQLNIKDVVKFL